MPVRYLIIALLATATSTALGANIRAGHQEIGGTLDYNRISRSHSGSKDQLYLTAGWQYFLKDRLAFGANLEFRDDKNSRSLGGSFGPLVTYYPFQYERIAPYATLSPARWWKEGEGLASRISSSLQIGSRFFSTEAVSFGPAVQLEHVWADDLLREQNLYRFLGTISLHL